MGQKPEVEVALAWIGPSFRLLATPAVTIQVVRISGRHPDGSIYLVAVNVTACGRRSEGGGVHGERHLHEALNGGQGACSKRTSGPPSPRITTITLTITRRGSAGVYGGQEESGKWKTPLKWGFWGAAGPGFEPGLTDPESGSIRSQLLLVVRKTA